MTLRSIAKTDLQLAVNSSQHMKVIQFFLILSFVWSSLLSAEVHDVKKATAHSRDFWRVKPKVLHRITEQREIITVVKSIQPKANPPLLTDSPQSELQIIGGGALNIGVNEAFKGATQFEKLTHVSEYIKEVKILRPKGDVFVHVAAFDYHARMTMRVTERKENPKHKKLEILVVDGQFKGMSGEFTFEEFKPNQTLMGVLLKYPYVKLPFPQFFMEFALEFVMKKVAFKLRSHLEKPSAV